MKLVIDRKLWLRGKGAERSYLLNDKGKMCCLGFLAKEVGCTDSEIYNVGTPGLSKTHKFPNWLVDYVDEKVSFSSLIHTYEARNTNVCRALIRINDDTRLEETERENRLAEEFAKHGVEVEFK